MCRVSCCPCCVGLVVVTCGVGAWCGTDDVSVGQRRRHRRGGAEKQHPAEGHSSLPRTGERNRLHLTESCRKNSQQDEARLSWYRYFTMKNTTPDVSPPPPAHTSTHVLPSLFHSTASSLLYVYMSLQLDLEYKSAQIVLSAIQEKGTLDVNDSMTGRVKTVRSKRTRNHRVRLFLYSVCVLLVAYFFRANYV